MLWMSLNNHIININKHIIIYNIIILLNINYFQLQLPELESDISAYLRTFISKLNRDRPFFAPLILIK